MNRPFQIDKDYYNWLKELKNKIRNVQLKAAVKVNSEITKQAVSQYQLTKSLPENLKPSLPSVEEQERELDELGGIDV
jgi:hypothetical protein